MADLDDIKDGKDFGIGTPQQNVPYTLKGCGSLDWGMQSRLARIFNPQSNRTVMLAFDHGYFQGPTTGLERIDLSIAPLFGETDVLMCTRGILRSQVPAATNKPVVLRASGGNSILGELSNECVAVAMEDALRLNVCAVAAQVYIGSEFEHQSINNIIKLVDAGARYGMPTLAVTGVGKEMARDARYFSLASRIAAEMGAQFVKTYYVDEGFEKVTASCPVPIVIAGGKKLPEHEALEMCWRAIDQGASGVDMGRNIFQSSAPLAMLKAVKKWFTRTERPRCVPVLAGRETGRSKMNVTLVEINIKPERVDEFLEVFRANHEGAIQEPGNLRFDVLQDPRVKTRFFIYEAYKDEEAVLAHKQTPHYLACVDKLEELMSEPRKKRSFVGLLPE
jgi:putative autoinducer-2 (AI-2) aldolase